MFRIKVNKNKLSVIEKDAITNRSVNVYPVEFIFSPDWEGLDRVVVFKNDDKAYKILLGETNITTIPWELMKEVGQKIQTGVYGSNGPNVVLPTVWANLGQVIQSVLDGDMELEEPTDPTPDEDNWLENKVKELEEAVKTIPTPIPEQDLRDDIFTYT